MSKKRPTNYVRTLKRQLGEAMAIAAEHDNARRDMKQLASDAAQEKTQYETMIFSLRKQLEMETNNRAAALAMLNSRDKKIRSLFETILTLNIELGRKEGYISRVRERDNPYGPEPVTQPNADPGLLREKLAGAHGERAVSSILDNIDMDTLDTVLGRPDDINFDRSSLG